MRDAFRVLLLLAATAVTLDSTMCSADECDAGYWACEGDVKVFCDRLEDGGHNFLVRQPCDPGQRCVTGRFPDPPDPLDIDTSLTASFTGPGRDATLPATILGGSGISALVLDPLNGSLNVTFDGFVFSQSGNNASTILCAGGNTAPVLVIRNSAILNGRKGITAQKCNAAITETIIASTTQDGATFETGSTWMLENDVIHHCGIALTIASQGVARFNTLAANGASNLAGGVNCLVSQLLEDSIIATNTQNAGGSQFSGSCSLDHVVTGNDSIVSTGKIAVQPVFVGAFDFHLSVGSPGNLAANTACCIDKQPAAPQNPTVDFERDPRPRGAAFDLGADEAN